MTCARLNRISGRSFLPGLLILLWVVSATPGFSVEPIFRSVFDPESVPSNGNLDPSSQLTIDTDAKTLSIDGGAAISGTEVHSESSLTTMVAFCFDSISLTNTVGVAVTGSAPLILMSRADMIINTQIHISGATGLDTGAVASPGAGGWPGGAADGATTDAVNGPGKGNAGKDPNMPGAGAGYSNPGGSGGTALGGGNALGGSSYGDAILSELQGGSGGGGGLKDTGGVSTGGGGGGGALGLFASGKIQLGGEGALQLRGGEGGSTGLPGVAQVCGGGGSGGAVVLYGREIENFGEINVSGGAGGSATNGSFNSGGGGGAGGRVALYYRDTLSTGPVVLLGGTAGTGDGGSYDGAPGGQGTLYSERINGSYGTLPVYEPFDYATGNLDNNLNGYDAAGNSSSPMQVVAGSLSSYSVPSPTGNKIALEGVDGEIVSRHFDTQTTTALYASFLLKLSNVPTNSGVAGEFMSLMKSNGSIHTPISRLYLQKGGDETSWEIGLRKSLASSISWAPGLNAGEVYYIVLKYNVGAGFDDDSISLWVNPQPGSGTEGLGAEETLFVSHSAGDEDVDVSGSSEYLRGLRFLSQNDAAGWAMELDELRLAENHDGVNPGPGSPLVLSTSRFSPTVELTKNTTVTWKIDFSENVQNVDPADFELQYEAEDFDTAPYVHEVTGTQPGNFFYVECNTGEGDGQISLVLKADSDIANTTSEGVLNKPYTSAFPYTIDRTPPTIAWVDPEAGETVTSLSVVRVMMNEEIGPLMPNALILSDGAFNGVTGSGAGPYEFTVSPVNEPGDGTITATLDAAYFADLAGNAVSDGSNSWSFTKDSSDLLCTISCEALSSGENTARDTLWLSLGFNKPVDPFNTTAFQTTNLTIKRMVAESGTTYSLKVEPNSLGTASISLPVGVVTATNISQQNQASNVFTFNKENGITPVYVKTGGAGGDGSTWATSLPTIKDGLNRVAEFGEIWVAGDTYRESIWLRNNVAVYGGFDGIETDVAQRDPHANPTVIDGLLASGFNATHVVIAREVNGAILEGFTIQNGQATDSNIPWGRYGGGLYCDPDPEASAGTTFEPNVIRKCLFLNNTAAFGGGAFVEGNWLSMEICEFENNSATSVGGGLMLLGNSQAFDQCLFFANEATEDGGGLYAENGAPHFSWSVFAGNEAGTNGGAVKMSEYCNGKISNSKIVGNKAFGNGAGLYLYDSSSPQILNTLIAGNYAVGTAGAAFLDHRASPLFANCNVLSNVSGAGNVDGIYAQALSPFFAYNTIFGGHAGCAVVEGDTGSDAKLRYCHFTNNGCHLYDEANRELNSAAGINLVGFGCLRNQDGYPRFRTAETDSWTARSSGSTHRIFENTSADWTENELAGRSLIPATGDAWGYIMENSATTLTVAGSQTNADIGDIYTIPDFHLAFNSPCMDKGNNNAGLTAQDFDGEDRIYMGTVDIGIDEYLAPPHVKRAVFLDIDGDGNADAGEILALIMSRAVDVTTTTLNAGHFYLPVSGDSLGGSGFSVSTSSRSGRLILLKLGQSPNLTVAGILGNASSGSPSGIDLDASLPAGAIQDVNGQEAQAMGAVDIIYTCIPHTTQLGPPGGTAYVADSENARYRHHRLNLPQNAVGATYDVTLQPPALDLDIDGAVQIIMQARGRREDTRALSFNVPVELTLQYVEDDLDVEGGDVEAGMRIMQLVDDGNGGTMWVPVPGAHSVDMTSNTVTAYLTSLNPYGSRAVDGKTREGTGDLSVFAALPGETIEMTVNYVKPDRGRVARIFAGLQDSGFRYDLSPGTGGDYTLHNLEIPNYSLTTPSDPSAISVTFAAANIFHRASSEGNSFPSQSNSLFVISVYDSGGSPVQFTDPVNVTVEFKDGQGTSYDDLVDWNGAAMEAEDMRVVRDTIDGFSVDFDFQNPGAQTVNTSQNTVTLENITNLTGPSGAGVWGAVGWSPNLEGITSADEWSLLE